MWRAAERTPQIFLLALLAVLFYINSAVKIVSRLLYILHNENMPEKLHHSKSVVKSVKTTLQKAQPDAYFCKLNSQKNE